MPHMSCPYSCSTAGRPTWWRRHRRLLQHHSRNRAAAAACDRSPGRSRQARQRSFGASWVRRTCLRRSVFTEQYTTPGGPGRVPSILSEVCGCARDVGSEWRKGARNAAAPAAHYAREQCPTPSERVAHKRLQMGGGAPSRHRPPRSPALPPTAPAPHRIGAPADHTAAPCGSPGKRSTLVAALPTPHLRSRTLKLKSALGKLDQKAGSRRMIVLPCPILVHCLLRESDMWLKEMHV